MRSSDEHGKARRGAIALLLVTASVSLAAADVTLRLLERPPTRGPLAWQVSVPWKEGVNSLGFRAKEPARVKRRERILLLGDSNLEGYHTPLSETFAAHLRRHLRRRDWQAEIIAMGAGGWGTDQQWIALRRYFEALEPDLVLVYYTHKNDLWNNLFPTHMGTPKPTYRLEDGILVPPDAELWLSPEEDLRGASRHGLLAAVRRALGGGYPTDADWEAWLPARQPAPPAGEDQETIGAAYAAAYGRELWDGEDMESERSHFAHLREPPTPRTRRALALQRALVEAMRDYCEERGAPLYFFRPELGEPPWEGRFAHAGRTYRLSGRAAAARLRALFAAAGVPLLEIDDLEPAHTWLPDDLHLNPRGNAFVAARVGDWLLEKRGR